MYNVKIFASITVVIISCFFFLDELDKPSLRKRTTDIKEDKVEQGMNLERDLSMYDLYRSDI